MPNRSELRYGHTCSEHLMLYERTGHNFKKRPIVSQFIGMGICIANTKALLYIKNQGALYAQPNGGGRGEWGKGKIGLVTNLIK